MLFNTFDEGIAPGGLRSKYEIKTLICYLYYSVKENMSRDLVIEAIREDELANFFEVSAAFDELVSDKSLVEADSVDGEQTYTLSENGRMIAMQLDSTVAYSVKDKALKCAIKLLADKKTARENFVDIEKTENGFNVKCTVSGGDVDLLSFTLYAPDIDQAEIIKKSFLSYPSTVYKSMLALMTKDRESVGEALEEVYGQID
ncbi:MAG: DUF4364 family protein [Ruminococcus sp.]|jgi:hypothetical protein|uniref:DUF4364 family protein n=1 Tax=Ruminococcus sp. JL13D9 TaxID=3233381 RepID=UPI002704F409|nr:DUF4364 family protein [Ruminococcus sp.]MDO4881706.1 DUF4364 family protein [Oscillospiraceae bacterium]MEE1016368.1 DUF4364 family protein [Ruminococcus sp.]